MPAHSNRCDETRSTLDRIQVLDVWVRFHFPLGHCRLANESNGARRYGCFAIRKERGRSGFRNSPVDGEHKIAFASHECIDDILFGSHTQDLTRPIDDCDNRVVASRCSRCTLEKILYFQF